LERALSVAGDPATLAPVERAQREILPQQMRRTIRKRQMFAPGERVVVAVSGGADSVALLAALAEAKSRLGITLLCGHFNHRLRAAEADGDEEFVAALCDRLGLPFHSARAELTLTGASIEARARRQRYAFLRALAAQQGATRIATAHTLDDQAETVLMRLLRGSGSDGLRAIRAVRGILVRPLIEVSRSAVLDYLAERGLTYRTDTSNRDLRFLRNRVRHEVLPVLTAINPSVRDSLARTAATIESDAADLDRRARRRYERLRRGEVLLASETARLADPLRSRVLRLWLRAYGVRQAQHSHVAALTALIVGRAHGAVSLPRGRQARVVPDANIGAEVLLLETVEPRQ